MSDAHEGDEGQTEVKEVLQKKPEMVEDEAQGEERNPANQIKLRTNKVEVLGRYKKMLESFRIDYKHELQLLGEKPRIVVLGAGDHAEVNVVFENAEVTNYVDSSREAEYRSTLGTPSEKFKLGAQLPTEPAHILIAFYDEEATSKGGRFDFERQIAHGGILLCKGKMAAELLEESAFEFMGTLTGQGGFEHSQKSKRTDYWEVAVKNDAEFVEASANLKPNSSMMSYDEAIDALHAAKMPTGESHNKVLANYRELYELAQNDPASTLDDNGNIHYKHAEMEKSVVLKKPPFGTVDDNLIFVLKKRRPGEAR